MHDELRDELLMELTTTDYWRALKSYLASWGETLGSKVTRPSGELMDLVRKEADSAQLAILRQIVADIENRAERTAKKERESR